MFPTGHLDSRVPFGSPCPYHHAFLDDPSVLLVDRFWTRVDLEMKWHMWNTLRQVAVEKAVVITTCMYVCNVSDVLISPWLSSHRLYGWSICTHKQGWHHIQKDAWWVLDYSVHVSCTHFHPCMLIDNHWYCWGLVVIDWLLFTFLTHTCIWWRVSFLQLHMFWQIIEGRFKHTNKKLINRMLQICIILSTSAIVYTTSLATRQSGPPKIATDDVKFTCCHSWLQIVQ